MRADRTVYLDIDPVAEAIAEIRAVVKAERLHIPKRWASDKSLALFFEREPGAVQCELDTCHRNCEEYRHAVRVIEIIRSIQLKYGV